MDLYQPALTLRHKPHVDKGQKQLNSLKIPQIIIQYTQVCEAPPHTVEVEWDTLYYLKFSTNSTVPSTIKIKLVSTPTHPLHIAKTP